MNKTKELIMMVIVLFSACQTKDAYLKFSQYPNLKLGFTTQNFIESTPVTKENIIKFVDYAKSNGFQWFELRDPEASLTLEECREISSYAGKEGIEIGYAIQKGFLDDDYWPVFKRGVKNAAVFNGPGTFRTLACGQEFEKDTTKKGWNSSEFETILTKARLAAKIAEENKLQFVFENGNEAFNGNEGSYFGTTDLLATTGNLVGWQFDVANPFNNTKVMPSPKEVENALGKYNNKLHYIHLKSSSGGNSMEILQDNPIAFDNVFQVMNDNNIPYVAIELVSQPTTEETKNNMEASITYLKQEGFIK